MELISAKYHICVHKLIEGLQATEIIAENFVTAGLLVVVTHWRRFTMQPKGKGPLRCFAWLKEVLFTWQQIRSFTYRFQVIWIPN